MQQPKSFPFDIRDVEEHENEELCKYFSGVNGKCNIQVGPKKYLLLSDYKNEAESIYNMPLRTDDIFIVTFPRSGTTWTQAIVWLLAYDLDFSTANKIPLEERSVFLEFSMLMHKGILEKLKKVHAGTTWTQAIVWLLAYDLDFSTANKIPLEERSVFLEFPLLMHKGFLDKLKKVHAGKEEKLKALDLLSVPGTVQVAAMPSPRVIKTHLPMSLLPPSLPDSCKVVYVARDPRDVAVSCYHLNSEFQSVKFNGDFKTFWSLFVKDLVYWSPFFDHLKEAWEMRHHPNMMFLFYEELSQNLSATVKRIADFLGKEYTAEQLDDLCTHIKFDNFKKNTSVNIVNMKELGIMAPKGEFIRKGKSGGWRDYFDADMSREAEDWIAKNLQHTDLRFPTV
ncbi:Sulfotransferase family cytosolic 1B member 1 [Papilio machaon]|uniref:Sulfotransferase family cytosolic 1B member 1 n=1 Tax=Papilio machaon TaxID=76193 RepID=A0A0N1IJY7_PAPMA|nr:Sulfotransferase family cytosolic 1B member 1 [Papilio machaon]